MNLRTARSLLSKFTGWCKDSKSLLETATAGAAGRSIDSPHSAIGARAASSSSATPSIQHCPTSPKAPRSPSKTAATLSECLKDESDPTEAFRDYQRLRQSRASRVQRRSQRLGRYYHFKGPARLVRNALLARRDPDALLPRSTGSTTQQNPRPDQLRGESRCPGRLRGSRHSLQLRNPHGHRR